MYAVVLKEVTKRYRDNYAVKDLTFQVTRGSIFGLLGPNGAGKTTTIRMMLDIIAPDSGEITVLGEQTSSETKRRVGYLPEERGLYERMSVYDQLLFFAKIRKIEKREAIKLVNGWLTRVDLLQWKNKTPRELSKGMAQKVQFIIAVLHDPELLILDEPFSGLDPVSVKHLKDIIIELKQQGKTIIFSTHQMEQVEQICDEICLIHNSTGVLRGSISQIKRSFGTNNVIIDFEGPDSFLGNGVVRDVNRYPTYTEVMLKEGADSQELLKRAIAVGARVHRFEEVEPSLNDIFISTVEKKK